MGKKPKGRREKYVQYVRERPCVTPGTERAKSSSAATSGLSPQAAPVFSAAAAAQPTAGAMTVDAEPEGPKTRVDRINELPTFASATGVTEEPSEMVTLTLTPLRLGVAATAVGNELSSLDAMDSKAKLAWAVIKTVMGAKHPGIDLADVCPYGGPVPHEVRRETCGMCHDGTFDLRVLDATALYLVKALQGAFACTSSEQIDTHQVSVPADAFPAGVLEQIQLQLSAAGTYHGWIRSQESARSGEKV